MGLAMPPQPRKHSCARLAILLRRTTRGILIKRLKLPRPGGNFTWFWLGARLLRHDSGFAPGSQPRNLHGIGLGPAFVWRGPVWN